MVVQIPRFPKLELENALLSDTQQPIRLILHRAIARGEIDSEIDLESGLHLVEAPLLSATLLQNVDVPLSGEGIEPKVARAVKALI